MLQKQLTVMTNRLDWFTKCYRSISRLSLEESLIQIQWIRTYLIHWMWILSIIGATLIYDRKIYRIQWIQEQLSAMTERFTDLTDSPKRFIRSWSPLCFNLTLLCSCSSRWTNKVFYLSVDFQNTLKLALTVC